MSRYNIASKIRNFKFISHFCIIYPHLTLLSGAAINVLWDLCRGHYRIFLLFPEWRKRQCQQTGTQNYTRKNNPSDREAHV